MIFNAFKENRVYSYCTFKLKFKKQTCKIITVYQEKYVSEIDNDISKKVGYFQQTVNKSILFRCLF